MNKLPIEVVNECKGQLLKKKAELLNQARATRALFNNGQKEVSGDEVDQSTTLLQEHTLMVKQERVRTQLYEIELALARIESGTFGACEETEELIETDRLLAIPWTRLSIEGAEIREEIEKRFAK